MAIALIAGLGNPGVRYRDTYHNAGARFVSSLASHHLSSFQSQSKLHGRVARLYWNERLLRLFIPEQFMNVSGEAVAACANFYKIAVQDVLVVHDEIDLPLGFPRLKIGGGHGGHNGLRSVIACLGSNDFVRLRLGVGRPERGGNVDNYLLKRAPADGIASLESSFAAVHQVLPMLLDESPVKAMNLLHSKPEPTV